MMSFNVAFDLQTPFYFHDNFRIEHCFSDRLLATVLISTLRSLTNRAIWGWARQEATANLCLGTRAAVQQKVGDFFVRLSSRREEVKRRCWTVLQAQAEAMIACASADFTSHANVDFTLASV